MKTKSKSNAWFLQWTISFAFSSVIPIEFLPRQVISPASITLCASVTVSKDVVTIEYASECVVRGSDIVVPLALVSCVVSFSHHVISVTLGWLVNSHVKKAVLFSTIVWSGIGVMTGESTVIWKRYTVEVIFLQRRIQGIYSTSYYRPPTIGHNGTSQWHVLLQRATERSR